MGPYGWKYILCLKNWGTFFFVIKYFVPRIIIFINCTDTESFKVWCSSEISDPLKSACKLYP